MVVALAVPSGCAKTTQPTTTTPCLVQSPTGLDPSTKREDVRRLLELTGSAKLAQQIVDPMFDTFQKAMPQIPLEFWEKMHARFDVNDLLEQVVDIYEAELSHEDIVALVHFYESPNGQRFTKALPVMTAKSQEAGRKYGEGLAKQIVAELIEAGYSIK